MAIEITLCRNFTVSETNCIEIKLCRIQTVLFLFLKLFHFRNNIRNDIHTLVVCITYYLWGVHTVEALVIQYYFLMNFQVGNTFCSKYENTTLNFKIWKLNLYCLLRWKPGFGFNWRDLGVFNVWVVWRERAAIQQADFETHIVPTYSTRIQ